jgi:hypothetical protein
MVVLLVYGSVGVSLLYVVHHTTRKQHAEKENKNSRGKRNKNIEMMNVTTKTGYNNINKEDTRMIWTNG